MCRLEINLYANIISYSEQLLTENWYPRFARVALVQMLKMMQRKWKITGEFCPIRKIWKVFSRVFDGEGTR